VIFISSGCNLVYSKLLLREWVKFKMEIILWLVWKKLQINVIHEYENRTIAFQAYENGDGYGDMMMTIIIIIIITFFLIESH
jgi:hypothetical protein